MKSIAYVFKASIRYTLIVLLFAFLFSDPFPKDILSGRHILFFYRVKVSLNLSPEIKNPVIMSNSISRRLLLHVLDKIASKSPDLAFSLINGLS
jgi:hypothetical protein